MVTTDTLSAGQAHRFAFAAGHFIYDNATWRKLLRHNSDFIDAGATNGV